MADRDPTLVQLVGLRILADLGGQATSNEIREHEDYTTMTHFYRLRDNGYIESRPAVLPDQTSSLKLWYLTERGRRAYRREVAAWERSYVSLVDDDHVEDEPLAAIEADT